MYRKQLESTFRWKISGELKLFRHQILKQGKEEIFDGACRIHCIRQIYGVLTELSGRMSPEELEACIHTAGLLEHLYGRWVKVPDIRNEELERSLWSEIRFLCGDVA